VSQILFIVAAMAGGTIRSTVVGRAGTRGTTIVNLVGSFLLGSVMAGGFASDATQILATGFCGSLTTLSGLVVDAVGDGPPRSSARRLIIETAAGVAAATLGYVVIR